MPAYLNGPLAYSEVPITYAAHLPLGASGQACASQPAEREVLVDGKFIDETGVSVQPHVATHHCTFLPVSKPSASNPCCCKQGQLLLLQLLLLTRPTTAATAAAHKASCRSLMGDTQHSKNGSQLQMIAATIVRVAISRYGHMLSGV